jgi:hypothetical protein
MKVGTPLWNLKESPMEPETSVESSAAKTIVRLPPEEKHEGKAARNMELHANDNRFYYSSSK